MTLFAAAGRPLLLAALAFAVGGGALSAAAALRRRAAWGLAASRALTAMAGFTVAGAVALVGALLANDFSLAYVAGYSSRSLATPYRIAALWGGMEGSLLFWASLVTAFSAIAVRRARQHDEYTAAIAGAVLAGVATFFLLLLALPADPFAASTTTVTDGAGLNPLLQSPGMIAHPPLLYTGFVAFSIPFAFAVAALLAKRTGDWWFTWTRRWTLFAWSALSIGIVLGGAWAYTELGWGGYWAWDPVENASFLPWLTATAFLHSVVVQEKRKMFKVWNVSLILVTYVLSVFGTFLTRSGILSSVHTFAEGPVGKWFLPFLALMLVGGFCLVAWRADTLRAEHRFDSIVSRETAFLANNVLFVAAAAAVLWGTVYPIVAEAVTGTRLSVGPPFFNSVFIPLALALVFLTGVGPLLSWRRTSTRSLARLSRAPVAVASATGGLLLIGGVTSPGVVIAGAVCTFTFTAIVGEFVRGTRLHRRRGMNPGAALRATIGRNRRRYGGYVVHLGVVLVAIGLSGAAFGAERSAIVDIGDSMAIGAYELHYEDLARDRTDEKDVYAANIRVERGDETVATLVPQRNLHRRQNQWQSEVAIRTTPAEDLYLVITSFDRDGAAALRAFVNPLTWWIWTGAAVMAAGMAIVISAPSTVRERATATAPVARPAAAAS